MRPYHPLFLWLTLFALGSAGSAGGLHNLALCQTALQAANLSYGTNGGLVEDVQTRLRNLGYYTVRVDGIFGSGTQSAVRRFQQDIGLTADGIVGPATLNALGILSENEITDELYQLASAIYGEARGEPYEGQVAVGAVVLNRVNDPRFPNTVSGVIYQSGAFDAVRDGQINLVPNTTALQAARDALSGVDPTGGALYYWNPTTATSSWIWTVPITYRVGNHVFGYK